MSEATSQNPSTYLIWSNQHKAWWAPNRRGYTSNRAIAGRYSFEQAIDECRQANASDSYEAPDETMVPEY